MPETHELKPNKSVFVNYTFIIRFIYSLIFFVVLFFVTNHFLDIPALFFLIIFIFLKILHYYALSVSYKKARYVFYPNRIVLIGGGVFSDFEVELVIKNITHVTMKLPFLRNKLFEIGDIQVESAGSSATEVYLSSLDQPEKVYKYIEKIMENNGFKLSKSNLVQQEQPKTIGVFFEVFKSFIATMFGVFFTLAYIGFGAFSIAKNYWYIFLPLSALFLIYVLFRLVLQFLDLKSRVYNLYSDTITYHEGFLTKNYSFIPIENLSDSTLTQTFVDKIIGLYDVMISCQGSKQEIHFKNIANGQKLEENIDKQIGKLKSLVGLQKVHKTAKSKAKYEEYSSKSISKDTKTTAQFQMDNKRTILPLLIMLPLFIIIFPLFPIWIVMFISKIIRVNSTKYLVKNKSMEQRYDFIKQKNTEFNNEKIMAIVFKESFIDKWFDTCSIAFWSIGSTQSLQFSNIKKTKNLFKSILAKSGIKDQETLYQMDSNFKVTEFLKSILPITIIAIILLIASFLATIILNPFFVIAFVSTLLFIIGPAIHSSYYYKNSKLTFYKDYIYFTVGIFFKQHYYVLYDNIKNITTSQYPFSRFGSIRFDVAGEQIVQQGKNTSIVSNNFKINFIDNISVKDELIDLIFYQRPNSQKIKQIEQDIENYSPKPLLVAKPDMSNSLFGLILISVIFFPLIILLPITLPLLIWSVKAKSYIIQPYRVISKSGIIYKKQKSVVFSKIDHINHRQGMVNKMFNNGKITVNTTGSRTAEITIKNIPDYKEFFQELKDHY